MPWPTPQEYNEAIQNPGLNLADTELARGQPELTALGLPRPITGNFASVYRLRCGQRDWAVRCFWREYADMRDRYSAIGSYLAQAGLPCTVGFNYLPRGIRVGALWYPVLRMEWVEGTLLNTWLAQNLTKPEALQRMAREWLELTARLERAGVAHGDLQHGNVLVTASGLCLVDYDAMFVPALDGRGSHELGHQHYQHPTRSATDFGPATDRFSAWTIYLSIAGVAAQPGLWAAAGAGDESLLLRRGDYANPAASPTLAALDASPDPVVRRLTERFASALGAGPGTLESLSASLAALPARRRAPAPPGGGAGATRLPEWVRDHVPEDPPSAPPYALRRGLAAGVVAAPVAMASGYVLFPPEKTLFMTAALASFGGNVLAVTSIYLHDVDGAARARVWVLFARTRVQMMLALLYPTRLHRWSELNGGVSVTRVRFWQRRRDASQRRLTRELSGIGALHAENEARRAELMAAVATDIHDRRSVALRVLRDRDLEHSLRHARLGFRSVPGITAWQVVRLRLAGVGSAAAVDDARLRRARRMGSGVALALALAQWRSETERAARRSAPSGLSERAEERLRARLISETEQIARRFAQRRDKLERLAAESRARHRRRELRMIAHQDRWKTRAEDCQAATGARLERDAHARAHRRQRLYELRRERDEYADVSLTNVLARILGINR